MEGDTHEGDIRVEGNHKRNEQAHREMYTQRNICMEVRYA